MLAPKAKQNLAVHLKTKKCKFCTKRASIPSGCIGRQVELSHQQGMQPRNFDNLSHSNSMGTELGVKEFRARPAENNRWVEKQSGLGRGGKKQPTQ